MQLYGIFGLLGIHMKIWPIDRKSHTVLALIQTAKIQHFRSNGFRSIGFRSNGFRSIGFRSIGFRSIGFRSNGFRSNGMYPTKRFGHKVGMAIKIVFN